MWCLQRFHMVFSTQHLLKQHSQFTIHTWIHRYVNGIEYWIENHSTANIASDNNISSEKMLEPSWVVVLLHSQFTAET